MWFCMYVKLLLVCLFFLIMSDARINVVFGIRDFKKSELKV